jgi:hypothetical protein
VSPTARSLALLRREGFVVDVVERFIAAMKISKDFLGFIDVIAVHPKERRIVGIQTTSAANLSSRIKKAQGLQTLRDWLTSGGEAEFHGWRRGPKGRWFCRRIAITLENLEGVEFSPPIPRRKPKRAERTLFDQLEPAP